MKAFEDTLIDMGANLAKARQAKHLSLRELAKMTGSSPAALCRLESGKVHNPSSWTLYKVCAALDVDIKDIF